MHTDFMFTSESVTDGHPDKLCDQISDSIVDRFLEQDPQARIAAESAVATGIVFIAVRFSSRAKIDVGEVAREIIRDVGYVDGRFVADECTVMTSIQELRTPKRARIDVASLSNDELDGLVTGHQVTAFGYACDQTPELMPAPIVLAHRLARQLASVRKSGELPYLMPDGQSQVGVEYRAGRPARVHSVTLIASQRGDQGPDADTLQRDLIEAVVLPTLADGALPIDDKTRIFVNPDGPMVEGGPAVHAGLTGRKTAIDSYGEFSRHSGAALSGKDPLRIDRVAAYAARHAAKNIVGAGLARACEVQLSYTIGFAQPVSVEVETYGTSQLDDQELNKRLRRVFDFRLGGIIRRFDLQNLPGRYKTGYYRRLAVYGHMGRTDLEPPWEALDAAEVLRD